MGDGSSRRRETGRQPERGAAIQAQACPPPTQKLPICLTHGSPHMGRALNLKFWQPSCVLVLIRQLAGSGKFKVWSAGLPGWWWVPSVPGSPEPGEVLLPAPAKPGEKLPTPAAAAHGGLPTNTASLSDRQTCEKNFESPSLAVGKKCPAYGWGFQSYLSDLSMTVLYINKLKECQLTLHPLSDRHTWEKDFDTLLQLLVKFLRRGLVGQIGKKIPCFPIFLYDRVL